MYRKHISHREMSGQYAHLIGKTLTWEETTNAQDWYPTSGKIRVAHQNGKDFNVDHDGTYRWIIPDPLRIRNVQIIG